ncbi:MAG: hypothetical protein AVDCRST_MAG30-2361 [uncultured Solirubrobacteraceae bacterium]|uniref:Uncharacterized protein n=1 Tax=uncultured Solirubrobacteraceae bacterium TaxID=1162706 RepID=A0A6J4SYP2_9ACTN|nr:MAG: hypothetical protein AVDCRST_MAG30-2361 [uncultured Solirubrobacteraceae bacterium]
MASVTGPPSTASAPSWTRTAASGREARARPARPAPAHSRPAGPNTTPVRMPAATQPSGSPAAAASGVSGSVTAIHA